MTRCRRIRLIAVFGLLSLWSGVVMAQPVDAQTRGDLMDATANDPPASQSTTTTANYDFIIVPSRTNAWTAIRVDTRSGESWVVDKGNVWKSIPEVKDATLAQSKYLVKYTRFAGSKIAIIRMDVNSGNSWFLMDDRWLPMPVFDQ